MKILVTGGAGFVGSHIVDKFKIDHNVYVIDNLSSGKKSNLPSGIKFIKMDINDKSLKNLLLRIKPDVIIHLAANASVRLSLDKP
ncbi:MAG: NAD-dependent epimerase/dehydratase family protein, partial [Planctomycetes bacterium]|nr:NAD-dependent epimerase/dehydratase family protein [Planctomycetota bacterium]